MDQYLRINTEAKDLTRQISFEELVNQLYESNSISIPLLAKKLAISISTLERLVKSKYGITPKQFITDYKLAKAAHLLQQEQFRIKQVAATTGFNSVAYFCHCFKKKFAKSPKVYAASLRDT